jgi:carbon-monoxide dehydrogenase small subunit
MELTVNGVMYEVAVEPYTTLTSLLRDELNLTGTNLGCGTGDCGACTVIMDGRAVNSCLVLALEAAGSEITTIEGLEEGGKLAPVQLSFIEHGAIQCGFCSPGMLITAHDFLQRNPRPTEEEATQAISGNLCRCTGYKKIIQAIVEAHKFEHEQDEREE